MKNAAPGVGLEPTTFVTMPSAHHANHLRHGGTRPCQNLAGFYWHATELQALCYCLCWLVGWLVGWLFGWLVGWLFGWLVG